MWPYVSFVVATQCTIMVGVGAGLEEKKIEFEYFVIWASIICFNFRRLLENFGVDLVIETHFFCMLNFFFSFLDGRLLCVCFLKE